VIAPQGAILGSGTVLKNRLSAAKDFLASRQVKNDKATRSRRRQMDRREREWRERALKAAVLAGDRDAWRVWYEASFDELYAYAMWRCAGCRERADDLVQQTWLTAVREIGRFDPDRAAFVGWLRGIAANILRNQRRRDRRQNHRSLGSDYVAAADDHESEIRVADALAALPKHYEEILRAKYFERLTVDQIAAQYGQSPKAIESLLTRARQAFREEYERTG
jgi:RNA polymerase sigma-70 factor (ECF subfamily)